MKTMQIIHLFIFTAVILVCTVHSARVYVDSSASGTNTGSSWTDAYRKLSDALNNAAADDSLLIAKGTYIPDYYGDTSTFRLKHSMKIVGGYSSGGSQDPDPKNNITILNGFLGDPSALTVVTCDSAVDVLIQGVWIINGQGFSGAAVKMHGEKWMIRDCVFKDNQVINNATNTVVHGGALYCTGPGSDCKIINSRFENNTIIDANVQGIMHLHGGAISCRVSNLIIDSCEFIHNGIGIEIPDNQGYFYAYGGAVYCTAQTFSITNTKFYDNYIKQANNNFSYTLYGGALYSKTQNCAVENTEFRKNHIHNHSAENGLGWHNYGGAAAFDSCGVVLISNAAFDSCYAMIGGALYINSPYTETADLTVNQGTLFENNRAQYGGAVYGSVKSAQFLSVSCINDTAMVGGAIVLSAHETVIDEGCEFRHNRASSNGGVLRVNIDTLIVRNSIFSNNYGQIGGVFDYGYLWAGGVYGNIRSSLLEITNATFGYNSAKIGGIIVCPTYCYIPSYAGNSDTIVQSMFSNGEETDNFTLNIDNSNFSNNFAERGGVLYRAALWPTDEFGYMDTLVAGNTSIKQSAFTSNRTILNEGGVFYYNGICINGDTAVDIAMNIDSCTFTDNETPALTGSNGGVGYFNANVCRIQNSIFKNNRSNNGGALWYKANEFVVENSLFDSNRVLLHNGNGGRGAAIYDESPYWAQVTNKKIISSVFKNNIAYDGIIYHYNGFIINCLFHNNEVWKNLGSLIKGTLHTAMAQGIINSTITDNVYHEGFSGFACDSFGGVIKNTIFWNTGEVTELNNSSTPTYSILRKWDGGGVGNIYDDPLFNDPLTGDFTLQSHNGISPGINAGDPATDTTGWPFDLAGNSRIKKGRIDIGAYETDVSPIVAFVDSVWDKCNGLYGAWYGYTNFGDTVLNVAIGPDNFFHNNASTQQPTAFLPGTQHNVFHVEFEDSITWELFKTRITARSEMASNVCPSPQIILKYIEIPVGKTKSVALNTQVVYTQNNPANLVWSVVQKPDSVEITIDPATNMMSLAPKITTYKIGDEFEFTLQVFDPLNTTLADTARVLGKIVKSEITIDSLSVMQSIGGGFVGMFKAKGNIAPVRLSPDKLYIYTKEGIDQSTMSYLHGITIEEVEKPFSSGGTQEYGRYLFTFNPTEKHVVSSSGIVGLSLLDWALREPAFNSSLRFVLYLTDGYSDAQQYMTIASPVDFDKPFTHLVVYNLSPHSQKIVWDGFEEELTGLTLTAFAEGDSAPAPKIIVFPKENLEQRSIIVDSLQDYRRYRHELTAVDIFNNIGISTGAHTTPSDLYTISGLVTCSTYTPEEKNITVRLYTAPPTGSETLVNEILVPINNTYTFNNITLQEYPYAIRAFAHQDYFSAPVVNTIHMPRENVENVNFVIVPDSLMETNAMRVVQLEESGDLKFIVSTNKLFAEERPVSVNLKWEYGFPKSDEGEQEFIIDTYAVSPVSDSTAVWSFIITRQEIQDKILSRTSTFDQDIRYVDAELRTATDQFPLFRIGRWSYPQDIDSFALFAPQSFRKPEKPKVTNPALSVTSGICSVIAQDRGLGNNVYAQFIRKNQLGQAEDTTLVVENIQNRSISLVSQGTATCRRFDWRHSSGSTTDQTETVLMNGFNRNNGSYTLCEYPFNAEHGEIRPYVSWLVEVKNSGDHYLEFLITEAEKTWDGLIYFNFGDDPIHTPKQALKVRSIFSSMNNEWKRMLVHLDAGITQINIFAPVKKIKLSGAVLYEKPLSRTMIGVLKLLCDKMPNVLVSTPEITITAGSLVADCEYMVRLYVQDRFGNTSDTAVFDSLHTLDNIFSATTTIHQEEHNGDLIVTTVPPNNIFVKNYDVLETVGFTFEGKKFDFTVHKAVTADKPLQIRIPHKDIAEALQTTESFLRHAVYKDAYMIFSKVDTLVTEKRYAYRRFGGCDKCDFAATSYYNVLIENDIINGTGHDTCLACDTLVKIFNIVLSRCVYSERDTIIKPQTSDPFVFHFPDSAGNVVASQEYRPVTEPKIDSVTVEARNIVFACNNLNTVENGGKKEQTAGVLKVSWTPGSICADTTVKYYHFGNYASVNNDGWVAFMPSFETAISSGAGGWRMPNTSIGTRHQWLDRFDIDDPLLGGMFYPNADDSILHQEMLDSIAAGTHANLPHITCGIFLDSGQVSQDNTDIEAYKLWVFAKGTNGLSSRYFYWGVNNNPIVGEVGDAYNTSGTYQWCFGPHITLSNAGKNTIELYMKDDGVEIAGIALSKSESVPTYTMADLQRWGERGFDLQVRAEDLAENTDITFNVQAIDRFGNVSPQVTKVIKTKASVDPVPNVVITPFDILINGYYPSRYPSFTVTLDRIPENGIDTIMVKLYQNNSGTAVEPQGLVVETVTEGYEWNVSVDSMYPLPVFPETLSALNNYEIQAQAVRSLSEKGNWTHLYFGVRADTGDIPEKITIINPNYTLPPDIRLVFDNGFEIADGSVMGTMKVLFDESRTGASNQELYIDNLKLFVTKQDDTTYVRIDSVAVVSVTKFRCSQLEEVENHSSELSSYTLRYAKFVVAVPVDSLYLSEVSDNDWRICADRLLVHDDNANPALASAHVENDEPVPFTSSGITTEFFTTRDNFFLENVVSFSDRKPGFGITSCRTSFNSDTSGEYDTYTIVAMGECDSCGPYLDFEVENPKNEERAFRMHDKLDKPVTITCCGENTAYTIDWNASGGKNSVSSSASDMVTYLQWPLQIQSYDFTHEGVALTSFSVTLPRSVFPEDKNKHNGIDYTVISGFSGTRIRGYQHIRDGALNFYGGAAASVDQNHCLTTENDYSFRALSHLSFVNTDPSFREYEIQTISGAELILPSWKNTVFNERDTIIASVSGDNLRIGYDEIRHLAASGDFQRTIGTFGDQEAQSLIIRGIINAAYRARDFQLEVVPKEGISLFTINSGFFAGYDTVAVEKSSMSLYSDFSINTFYGTTQFGGVKNVQPEYFRVLDLDATGVDVVNTQGGNVRFLLLNPSFNLDYFIDQTDNSNKGIFSIYNAAVGTDKDLYALGGKITFPQNYSSLSHIEALQDFTKRIMDITFNDVYLGYERDAGVNKENVFTIGAGATVELGEAFKNIGMQHEKIILDHIRISYAKDRKGNLDSLYASALSVPRYLTIGPKNLGKTDDGSMEESGVEDVYVELKNAGKGLEMRYSGSDNGSKKLQLDMNNWTLRLTDQFPLEALQNLTLNIKNIRYEKEMNSGNVGRITQFEADGEYIPPGGRIQIGDFSLENVVISAGCDQPGVVSKNETNNQAYISLSFDKMKIGDSLYDMSCGAGGETTQLKVYFDGKYYFKGCFTLRKKIAIHPWKSQDPDIFIDPGTNGLTFVVEFSSEKVGGKIKNVCLRSKHSIEVLDAPLNIVLEELGIFYDREKKDFAVEKFDVKWILNKRIAGNDAFKIYLDTLKIGFDDGTQRGVYHIAEGTENEMTKSGRVFYITTVPKIEFKLGKKDGVDGCDMDVSTEVGMLVNVDNEDDEPVFIWGAAADVACQIGMFDFGGTFFMNENSFGFESVWIDMGRLKEYGVIEEGGSSEGVPKVSIGVELKHVVWTKQGASWNLQKDMTVIPRFNMNKGFEVCNVTVMGTFDFTRLFKTPYPGIGYRNIKVKLDEDLGGAVIPTNMNLYIDGRKPFVHPEFDEPNKIVIVVPSIKLTEDIKLGEARMEFGIEPPSATGLSYETWYFRGMATMNLKGAVDKLTVDVAFEKPQPWENITGIRHAKLTIKLSKNARIPLGTTPFYLSGFMGALYDGSGQPEGAIACKLPKLAPGLKVEAAIFLEFKEPTVLNGMLGFWVHLRRLNFGVNGEITGFEGVLDADACAAIYNNGSAFHGHFIVLVQWGLAVKGGFTVDVWQDDTGGNFTSSANASIGLTRGSIYKGRWLKIPRNTRWFMDLFTNMGKFSNQQKGFTTGLKILSKYYGLGLIGKRFVIGNVSKYKLKQAPVIITRGILEDVPNVAIAEPGLLLSQGDIISIVAAVDSGYYAWDTDSALRIIDYDNNMWDMNADHYLPVDGYAYDNNFPIDSSGHEQYMNVFARTWINNHDNKKIKISMPNPQKGGTFQYMLFTGISPPETKVHADTLSIQDSLKVRFSGTVHNFYKDIHRIHEYDTSNYTTIKDTLLKQKMNLRLYYSLIAPQYTDSAGNLDDYRFNFIEIPFTQFEGYHSGDKCLADNDNVYWDPHTRILTFNNLTWNTTHALPGKAVFRAAVELVDFIVEDGSGKKKVLADHEIDSAMILRQNPRLVYAVSQPDSILCVEFQNRVPLTRPQGFTATGSVVSKNFNEEDETRSIFLRWKQDDNPSLRGYEIRWYPTGKPFTTFRIAVYDDKDSVIGYKDSTLYHIQSVRIGKTDNYTITIPPVKDTFHVADSIDAEPITSVKYTKFIRDTIYEYTYNLDSAQVIVDIFDTISIDPLSIDTISLSQTHYSWDTIVTLHIDSFAEESEIDTVFRIRKLWGNAIDTTYFYAEHFDVVIMPLRDTLVEITEENWRETGQTHVETVRKFLPDSSLSAGITNVAFSQNTGTNRNDFKISFYKDDTLLTFDQPVIVPLNTSRVIETRIAVTHFDTTGEDPSNYGEIVAKVKHTADDSIATPVLSLPSIGSGMYHFTITADSVASPLSFTPVTKTITCAEAFSNSCVKYTFDHTAEMNIVDTICGCQKACDTLTQDCDPNSPTNELPDMDPCNGQPDKLVRQRTPFGDYTIYVAAVNNGRRAVPVPDDGTNAFPAVYDSVRFTVAPPEPLLHTVHPEYILAQRNDTLRLAVSNLWPDSSVKDTVPFLVQAQWVDRYGVLQTHTFGTVETVPMSDTAGMWPLQSNADYMIKIVTNDFVIDTSGEIDIAVSIVNRDYDMNNMIVTIRSNEVRVAYIVDPYTIECPDNYDVDSLNSAYVMEWIGNFPHNPSKGDTMTVYFSELHDVDPDHYEVKLRKHENGSVVDSILVPNFTITYSSITFRLPETIDTTSEKKWEIITNLKYESEIEKCHHKQWGKDHFFSISPLRTYAIKSHDTGFAIVLVKGNSIDCKNDHIRFSIGKIPYTGNTLPWHYYNISTAPVVSMQQSNWVTAQISDRDGGNVRYIDTIVTIQNNPILVRPNGDTVQSGFNIWPGDTVNIVSRKPGIKTEWHEPEVQTSYRFRDAPTCDNVDMIVFDVFSRSPLYLENRSIITNSDGSKTTLADGYSVYTFTLNKPSDMISITIPHHNVQAALQKPIYEYPLLIRINPALVPGLDTIIGGDFHFRSRNFSVLPHEIEQIDLHAVSMDVWIKIDKLDPAQGNTIVYLMKGKPVPISLSSSQSVWSNYTGVWHCTSDNTLHDASGKCQDIPVSGKIDTLPGVCAAGIQLNGTQPVWLQGNMPLKSTDNGVTLSAWIYLDSGSIPVQEEQEIVAYMNTATLKATALSINNDAGISFFVNGTTLRSRSGVVEHGTWLHVAATYSWFYDDGKARIYVNGLQVAEQYINEGENISFNLHGSLFIGGDGNDKTFHGIIDELRIAPMALHNETILLDYMSQRKRNDFMHVPVGKTSVIALTGKDCRLVTNAQTGDPLFADTGAWVAEYLPFDYEGNTWLKLPYASRKSSDDTLFTMIVNGPAQITVLANNDEPAPRFLNNYTKTTTAIAVRNSISNDAYTFTAYTKHFSDTDTLVFGGPAYDQSSVGELPYAVLCDLASVKPEVSVVSCQYPFTRIESRVSVHSLFYADREYEILSMPSVLDSGVLLQTANNFKHFENDSFCVFKINQRSDIYLLLDTMYTNWPDFVNRDWKPQNGLLITDIGAYNLIKRTEETGAFRLPAPRSGHGKGNISSYTVMVKKNTADSVIANLFPETYEVAIIDTGVQIYTDTAWYCKGLSSRLREKLFIRPAQNDYWKTDTALVRFDLKKARWIYCAVDINQSVPPSFITEYNDSTGTWEYAGLSVLTNAPGNYRLYRKFFKPGHLEFGAARCGASADNMFNYLLIFVPQTDSIEIDDYDIIKHVKNGDTVFNDNTITIEDLPITLDSLLVIKTDFFSYDCDTITFTVKSPIRVYLGIDPAFDKKNTFIETQMWKQENMTFSFSDPKIPYYLVWSKDFKPGIVRIPGIHCPVAQPRVHNYVVFIEFLHDKIHGYRAKNLAIRGIGDQRSVKSQHFTMRNLDISYAYGLNLKSRSWMMNVTMHGGKADPGDTLKVLSPFKDTVIFVKDTTAYPDTGIVVIDDTVSLADLMPVLINADGVTVNAVDLTSTGTVRIIFTNNSSVDVQQEFVVVLFEDNDNDYRFDDNYDTYIGRAIVRGIQAGEYKMYEIAVENKLAFPQKVICAFVDANLWIEEINEKNNAMLSDGVCKNHERISFISDWDWTQDSVLLDIVPNSVEPLVCLLTDTDLDSFITEEDDLYLVYVDNNLLHAINTQTYNSLFIPFYVNGLFNTDLLITDMTGDLKPEIIIGSDVFSSTGEHQWNALDITAPLPSYSMDCNGDGRADSISIVDSCIVIYSATSDSLLYVYPLNKWKGSLFAETKQILAHIEQQSYKCSDIQLSYPRIESVTADTVSITIRVANAGTYRLPKGISIYMATIDSLQTEEKIADTYTYTFIEENHYIDITVRAYVPNMGGITFKFIADSVNRWFECNERNNTFILKSRRE